MRRLTSRESLLKLLLGSEEFKLQYLKTIYEALCPEENQRLPWQVAHCLTEP